MANIDIDVGGRRYNVACRDGEEDRLRSLAGLVDRRAQDAAEALGGLTETRQLLLAALLLADDLDETRNGGRVVNTGAAAAPAADPAVADALERIAGRMENLAGRLEQDLARA